MTHAQFLELLNAIAKLARPLTADEFVLTSMDTKFTDTPIDSLDMMMIHCYIGVIYEIDDEVAKTLHPATPLELLELVELHRQAEHVSVAEAMEKCQ